MIGTTHPFATAAVSTASALSALIGVSPAAPTAQVECGWRITAVHVLAELTGDTSPRGDQLRQALLSVGANKPDFVPDQCQNPGGQNGSGGGGSGQSGAQPGDGSNGSGGSGSGGSGGSGSGSGGSDQGQSDQSGQDSQNDGQGGGQGGQGGSAGDGSGGSGQGGSAGDGAGGNAGGQGGGQGGSGDGQSGGAAQGTGQGATAAETLGWGEPDKVDDFDGDLSGWNIYDGPGHAGKGTRSPEAASVSDGLLTINGTGDGTTAGMAWGDGQKYGRWEGRMKAPEGSPSYNALFLLWPSEENFPVGGEIDFAEITDQARQKVNLFLHYGEDNQQVQGDVAVDATQWHNWAVEWTPEGVTTFLDGKQWWHTDDTSVLPPGPMHLCIQLDWFPEGDTETGQMQVDWVKQWSLQEGAGQPSPGGNEQAAPGGDQSSSAASG